MTTPHPDIATAINANNRAFEAALAAGDAAAMTAVYTSNRMLMPPHSPIIPGVKNIETFWRNALETGVAQAELETVELDQVGDSVNEVGKFTLKTADGSTADRGKFIVVWKQENGKWLWHHDIFNSDIPAS